MLGMLGTSKFAETEDELNRGGVAASHAILKLERNCSHHIRGRLVLVVVVFIATDTHHQRPWLGALPQGHLLALGLGDRSCSACSALLVDIHFKLKDDSGGSSLWLLLLLSLLLLSWT